MEIFEKESVVSRMVFGNFVFTLDNKRYMFQTPTLEDKYNAQRIFDTEYQYGLWSGMYSSTEMEMILADYEFWTPEHEEQMKMRENEIENFKVKLFEMTFRSDARRTIRKSLHIANKNLSELTNKKHAYDHMTAYGYALSCKMRYLLLQRFKGETGEDLNDVDYLIDKLISIYNKTVLSDKHIREISRTEPWRSLWMTSTKDAQIFQRHPYELNDEQKSLLFWSMTYDNIYQNMDCPHDSVIEDDDMLDGWMILQRRKREGDMDKKEGQEAISDKVGQAQEVYVMVDNIDDARKVEAMNSFEGNLAKRKKMKQLEASDSPIHEGQIVDTKQRLALEMVRMQKENLGGKRT